MGTGNKTGCHPPRAEAVQQSALGGLASHHGIIPIDAPLCMSCQPVCSGCTVHVFGAPLGFAIFRLRCCVSLTVYDLLMPTALTTLTQLEHLLDKARQHAQEKHFNADHFAQARLIIDMHPLTKQIQIASDVVKGGAAGRGGIAPLPRRRADPR